MKRQLIDEERERQIERPFGFIPFRILQDGYWEKMSLRAKVLYCLLCLLSDRRGLSFYSDRKLSHLVGIKVEQMYKAREELQRRDLLCYFEHKGGKRTYQLLSLPNKKCKKEHNCKHKNSFYNLKEEQYLEEGKKEFNVIQVRKLISHLSQATQIPK